MRCTGLAVTQEFSDDWQAKAGSGSDAGMCVPQIMDAHFKKSGST
jgi:hypothetical protein